MNDMFSQFKKQSAMIRVAPHERTWERVEAKLHAHRSRRKLFNARLIGIAAAIICLVAVSSGVLFYTKWQEASRMVQYSQSMEELNSRFVDSESIYDIQKIRRSYADLIE
jgi:hypothetical protein